MTRADILKYQRIGDYDHPTQGTWMRVRLDGKTAVWIGCPACGQNALLDHGVDENGDVNPSLVCDNCGYHEYVHLVDWDGGWIRK